MERVRVAIQRLARDTNGQDLLEYGLLAALIALVAMAGVSALGDTVYSVFWKNIGQAL
jgi:Flp pilus assembly pilin Flp